MSRLDEDLAARLAAIRDAGLHRKLRRLDSPQSPRVIADGQPLLNFSSNDYLGLANEPALKAAAIQAIEQYGAGSGSSRLICGSLAPHQELETLLAEFKGTETALSFSSGYAAAMGTIGSLISKADVVIIDKLVHACIVDSVSYSGAKMRVFAHNDLDDLEQILKWSAERASKENASRTLVVTESIFSMDGDRAPLKEIVELKDRFGAWLMVDEAHGSGLFGPGGRGLAEELGVSDRIEIQMGTLGKSFGASGGFICGSRALVDFLINRARTFIFSTAPVPAVAAAAAAGVRFVMSDEGKKRRETLWTRVGELDSKLKVHAPARLSAIFPIILGDETRAVETSARLRGEGLLVPAIRYPTVARGKARLRVTVTASHTPAEVQTLAQALANCAPAPA